MERTDNKVETLPEALGMLTNLEVIDACRNKIGSVKSLGPLHNLVTLKLDQNEISSLSLMQVITCAPDLLLHTYFARLSCCYKRTFSLVQKYRY